MAVIKFRTEPEAVWISGDDTAFDLTELGQYSKEERGQIKFQIFPMTPELVSDLTEKHTTKELRTIQGQTREISTLDEKGYQDELMSTILPNWKGIVGQDEAHLECNPENIRKMFNRGYPKMGAAIVRVASSLMANKRIFESKNMEQIAKN